MTTKIELGEVRELTESTDWFLPFHLLHRYTPISIPQWKISMQLASERRRCCREGPPVAQR
jgi:hypothetical protein